MFTYFKPVEKKQEAPHFEVILDFIHGDADGYSDSVTKIDTEENLVAFLREVDVVSELDSFSPDFSEAAEKLGLSEDDVSQIYYEILPQDITCDNYRAQLQGKNIFYVDAQGVRIELIQI